MDRKQELRQQYKERDVIGGVCRITCEGNGRYMVFWDDDVRGAANRHQFSVMTDSCFYHEMREDWKEYGAKSFRFEVLEELEKEPEQTAGEFRRDLETLLELWLEKSNPALRY